MVLLVGMAVFPLIYFMKRKIALMVYPFLDKKKFTNSLYIEMNEMFSFIKEENLVYVPLVEDKNIITVAGSAFNDFAIAVARKVGYDCPDKIYSGRLEDWKESDYKFHLSEDCLEIFKKEFEEFIS